MLFVNILNLYQLPEDFDGIDNTILEILSNTSGYQKISWSTDLDDYTFYLKYLPENKTLKIGIYWPEHEFTKNII